MSRALTRIPRTGRYSFLAQVWKHEGPAGWYFVSLPKRLATRIRKNHGFSEEGWGRLKVSASLGKVRWGTAIWYDTRARTYLLPLKASVRKSAAVNLEERIRVNIDIDFKDPKLARWLWPN